MDFPSFFSSMFGRDCSEIETDPKADPFDKEICHSFRQLERSFDGLIQSDPSKVQGEHGEGTTTDPKSLRDSILSRPDAMPTPRTHKPGTGVTRRRRNIDSGDEDLDDVYQRNPSSVLDEVLRDDKTRPHPMESEPQHRTFQSGVSITTIRKPDGSVEQRKTVRDSTGREETTITHTSPSGDIKDPPTYSDGSSNWIFDWLWPRSK